MISYGCDACGGSHGRWRPVLGRSVCASCERGAGGRDPVLLGEVLAGTAIELGSADRQLRAVPDPRSGGGTSCKRCGASAEWHRTVRGKWILIEPGERAVGSVPAGKRWRIAGDGTAVNLGSAIPADTCRISHFDLCPAGSEPSRSSSSSSSSSSSAVA